MFEIISLNPNEGVASVADKIINCQDHFVYLLFSEENDLFNDLFSLKLLKREAQKNGKILVLVIPEKKEGINLDVIKKSGLEIVLENELDGLVNKIQKIEGKEEKKSKKEEKLFRNDLNEVDSEDINRNNTEEEYIIQSEKSDDLPVGKINVFTPDKEVKISNHSKKLLIIWGFLSLLILGLVSYLFLDKATIKVVLRQNELTFQKNIIASQNIHRPAVYSDQIPAEVITLNKTERKEFSATGNKVIRKKAEGEIIIYNQFSSQPQKLVATTRFETKDGKIFRLVKSVIVPGAKVENGKIVANSIKVKVIADQPGIDYNISSSDFTIPGFKGSPKFYGFYAKSNQAMAGGRISNVKIVTDDDLKQAKIVLKKNFSNNSKKMTEEIIKKISNDYEILDNKVNYTRSKITCSADSGAVTDNFSCQEDEKVEAVVFKKEDLITLIKSANHDFFDNKIILRDKSKFNYSLINYDFSNHQVGFKVNAKIVAERKINKQQLKTDLMGKSREEVRNIINQEYPNIAQVEVIFWPIWTKKIPENINRIKIEDE
ncbi:MAG TPA: hypothetical protein ENL06_01580 [Candidatus Portnoybacteria bacterium]|nr:hypothetical protein [Candidatus Portnoybacteria bacterium]